MMYSVLMFLSFFQSVVGFSLMSSSLMQFKEPIKKRIGIGFFVMMCGIVLLSYTLYTKGIDSLNNYAVFVIFAIELSWFLICSADRFYVSLFIFLTFVTIYLSISYISDTLSIAYVSEAFSMGFKDVTFIGVRMLIRTGIYLVILPLLYKYVRKKFRMLVNIIQKEWRVAAIVPCMFLIIQIIVLYYPAPYWRWERGSWLVVIINTIYVLFLAVYYLLYIQANGLVEKYRLEKKQLLMTQQEKLWESELQSQQTITALAKQQRHDLHHHNMVIMVLLQSNDMSGLKDYMRSYDDSIEKSSTISYCLNPIINSIVRFYANKAKSENIKTSFFVNAPRNIDIESIDLTCVLGNALENALEGCQRLPTDYKKEISMAIKYFDNRLRIMIENSCREDIVFDKELPKTQKTNGGTGTSSILYTAEKYDGTADFSLMNGKFVTLIVLNEHQ